MTVPSAGRRWMSASAENEIGVSKDFENKRQNPKYDSETWSFLTRKASVCFEVGTFVNTWKHSTTTEDYIYVQKNVSCASWSEQSQQGSEDKRLTFHPCGKGKFQKNQCNSMQRSHPTGTKWEILSQLSCCHHSVQSGTKQLWFSVGV